MAVWAVVIRPSPSSTSKSSMSLDSGRRLPSPASIRYQVTIDHQVDISDAASRCRRHQCTSAPALVSLCDAAGVGGRRKYGCRLQRNAITGRIKLNVDWSLLVFGGACWELVLVYERSDANTLHMSSHMAAASGVRRPASFRRPVPVA